MDNNENEEINEINDFSDDEGEGMCDRCGSATRWNGSCIDCILYHACVWDHDGSDNDADLFDRVIGNLYDIAYNRGFNGHINNPFNTRKNLKFIVRLYMRGYTAGTNARLLHQPQG